VNRGAACDRRESPWGTPPPPRCRASSCAERVGFEPTVRLPVHMISSHAPSASRSPLRVARPRARERGRGRAVSAAVVVLPSRGELECEPSSSPCGLRAPGALLRMLGPSGLRVREGHAGEVRRGALREVSARLECSLDVLARVGERRGPAPMGRPRSGVRRDARGVNMEAWKSPAL
jgi:hypothetical protein